MKKKFYFSGENKDKYYCETCHTWFKSDPYESCGLGVCKKKKLSVDDLGSVKVIRPFNKLLTPGADAPVESQEFGDFHRRYADEIDKKIKRGEGYSER